MKKRVLIFDDDEGVREVSTLILESEGYEVETRKNSINVIKTLEQVRPHLIMMDYWIPGEGGIEATKKIKKSEEFREVPVVFFSASNEVKQLGKEAGADAFLAKPFDLGELEEIVQKLLHNHSNK